MTGPVGQTAGAIAIVLAAGDLPSRSLLPRLLNDVDVVVAADAGLAHAAELGLRPQRIVGDLDSVDPVMLEHYQGVRTERHRVDKDELDLELALIAARELGATSFRVLGAFGGRLDHSLAALFIGARWAKAGSEVSLHGGSHEAWLCLPGRPVVLSLATGTTVSILALGEQAVLSSVGLRYPLHDTRLGFGTGLGMSNVAADEQVSVSSTSGTAAVIVEHVVW